MLPARAICPALKAMLDLSLSVRTRPTSRMIPRLLVTLTTGTARARDGPARIAPRARRASSRSAARCAVLRGRLPGAARAVVCEGTASTCARVKAPAILGPGGPLRGRAEARDFQDRAFVE